MFLIGKDEDSQSQDIRRVLFHIDQLVAVGLSSGCSVYFQKALRPLVIHLMRQCHDLRYVSQDFEDEHLMCIENKGNNKITELRTILQRESQNSSI